MGMQNASHHSAHPTSANNAANQMRQKALPPTLHGIVKLLAQVAVDRYWDEFFQSKRLPPETTEQRSACVLPEQSPINNPTNPELETIDHEEC